MTTQLVTSLDHFIKRWCQYQQQSQLTLQIEHDKQWLSPASEQEAVDGELVAWSPTRQQQNNNMQALQDGLGIEVNQQLQDYYCRYWSDNLNATTERGRLQLLQPWNQDDFVRLQQNLIAHVLMKRRLKQKDTLFFATTDDEDFIISVLNATGEVVLEQVGREPCEILAPNLAAFLDSLEPESCQSVF